MRLNRGPSLAFDGFFLAMAHARLGHLGEARSLYDRSVAWLRQFAAADPELLRFRAEAEAVVLYDPIFPANPFVE